MDGLTRVLILTVLGIAVVILVGSERSLPAQEPVFQTGQIVVSPENPSWLVRHEVGPFFLCGVGDPEGFLYRGERQEDGTRLGDQHELIDKLALSGANGVYVMAVRSHGGDGDETENPFIEHDPSGGINEAILDQWYNWFVRLDQREICIHLFLYDDSSDPWRGESSGEEPVSQAEADFVIAMVERFADLRNLVWCIAEEYSEAISPERVRTLASLIRETDPHDHPIAVHQLAGTRFDFADDPAIDQFAIQLGHPDGDPWPPQKVYESVLEAWNHADGRYNLNMAELGNHYDEQDHEITRQRSWAAAMAGAYVMVIGMDIENTDPVALRDCGVLRECFESVPLSRMSPQPSLPAYQTRYVLAEPGETYLLYSPEAGEALGLRDLQQGLYDFQWLDIETGMWLEVRSVDIPQHYDARFPVPDDFGDEVALVIRRIR